MDLINLIAKAIANDLGMTINQQEKITEKVESILRQKFKVCFYPLFIPENIYFQDLNSFREFFKKNLDQALTVQSDKISTQFIEDCWIEFQKGKRFFSLSQITKSGD